MHTWLPDAHSEAPSPASAMLSAALLNTGMYAIIRFQALTHAQLGTHYAARILLIFGFASVIVGALFIVLRGNYKRLFAYSSVEHMGIIAIALGFGGVLGFYGALLHTLTHAIGKAVLFLTSGDVVLRYRTQLVDEVRGVLERDPADRRGAAPGRGGRRRLAAVRPVPERVHDRPGGASALERRAGRGAAGPARGRVRRAGRCGGGHGARRLARPTHGRARPTPSARGACWPRRRWSPGSPCCWCSGCGFPAASIG